MVGLLGFGLGEEGAEAGLAGLAGLAGPHGSRETQVQRWWDCDGPAEPETRDDRLRVCDGVFLV